LGQRLRAFEHEWDKQKDEGKRRRTVKPLTQATQMFFSLRLGEAAKLLDEARFKLLPEDPTPDRRWAEALFLSMPSRFLDVDDELKFRVATLYKVAEPEPAKAAIRVRLALGSDGPRLPFPKPLTLGTEAIWPLKDAKNPEGDHTLELRVEQGKTLLAVSRHTLSLVAHRDKRLAALKAAAKEIGEPKSTDAATFLELTQLLEKLAAGQTLETHYPAARLLQEAEQLSRAIQAKETFYGWPRAGQFWLKFAGGKSRAIVRIQAPEIKKGQTVALVIALHGAGGSENLFFDGYGDGLVAKLCAERGWLLAAPRSPLFGFLTNPAEDVIDELSKLYPVDKSKVFIIGHSMGAAQALAAAQRSPGKFAAVAALGGGRPVKLGEEAKKLPFFVGVGKDDFARSGATSLANALKKAGIPVHFREYPDIEHLVIVQHALPDVFAFFDEALKR